MKRICAIILLLALLLTSLSSCSNPAIEYGTNSRITISSSDVEYYGDFLTVRLGDLCGNVTLGIGNSSDYGIDMTEFEDDGYIIKTVGDETVIFGKTADGLDRACRRYANDIVLYGNPSNDVYHEGYRISEFELFGCPISDYSMDYPKDSESAAFAASEFSRLTAEACGVMLENSESDKAVRFILTDNGSLGQNGYRYYEENGDLILEFANEDAAVLAVYGFFEDECSWSGLTYGEGDLKEQDLLQIPRGLDKTVVPAFDYLYIGKSDTHIVGVTDDILCFSDKAYYTDTVSEILLYLEKCAAEGTSPKNIEINIGDGYCECNDCQQILEGEGSTAASAVHFANKLTDDARELYPDITIKLIAERDTDTVTVTKPYDNVNIVLQQDGLCSIHGLSGNNCTDSANKEFTEQISAWLSITDNVYIKQSENGESLIQYYSLGGIHETLKHLHSLGVKGVHIESGDLRLGLQEVEKKLSYSLNRNIDMTPLEYEEKLCDILESLYGDGWVYVREYITLLEDSRDTSLCGNKDDSGLFFNTEAFAENFDHAVSLIENAVGLACSEEQQKNCELLSCHVYYMGCLSSYYGAYYSLDKGRVEILEQRYALIKERLNKYGFDISDALGVTDFPSEDLYDSAWQDWIDLRDTLYSGEIPDEEEIKDFAISINENTADDSFTFAFRTDSHYSCEVSDIEKTTKITIAEERNSIARYVDVDLFVHGGDLINGKHDSKTVALQSISEAVSVMRGIHQDAPMFFIRGNHDDNSWYGYDEYDKLYYAFPADTVVTTDEWREITGHDKYGKFVTDETGAYGYFDHEESKIRVLFLDTSDLPYYDDGTGIYKYGAYSGHGIRQDQLQFMADAMMFSDKGEEASEWAIFVMSHVPVETMKTVNSKYRFGGLDASGRNFYAFLRLLKAYQRGTAFNESQTSLTNYGDGGYASNGKWDDTKGDFSYKINADFSKNGPGEVIGIVTGHTHINNYSNEVGKVSYTSSIIYPELSYGYPYFCVGSGGLTVFTVDRNGDGTGTIYVDHIGQTTVTSSDMIADGDTAVVTKDNTMTNVITTTPDTGTVASGKYSVKYSQNR